jgi:phosphoglucomutase/phosphoglucomutase/phosphopentomutase
MVELCERVGSVCTNGSYYKCDDAATRERIFARLRNGGAYATHVGEYEIASVRDLTTGVDTAQPDGRAAMYTDPTSHMITFTFANGCVATLRTSGTEPKIKFYVEQKGAPGQPREEVAAEVDRMARAVVEEMLQPELNNLERPQ